MADNLEAVVKTVVADFIASATPFTSLDVSNKVKESLSYARHREVAPLVRSVYNNGEMGGYERTTIEVNLATGDKTSAYLYHSTNDTWYLDSRYNLTQRSQVVAPVPKVTNIFADVPQLPAKPVDSADVSNFINIKMPALLAPVPVPVIANKPQLPPTVWEGLAAKVKRKLFG